jgi:hypothetical protein
MTTAEQAKHATEIALLVAVDHALIPDSELGTLAGLAAVVRSGRELNRLQAALAWRVLHRHRARLAARGVTLPGPQAETRPAPVVTASGPRPEVLVRGDGRIAIRHAPFETNESLKLGLHATFDNRHREWHLSPTPTGAAGVLALLRDHHPEVTPRVLELADEARNGTAHRAVLDPEHPVPTEDIGHLVLSPLWEHQRRALAYSSAVSASMIAVPMGGGKTASTVATVNGVNASRALIVCPNKVRGVWPREVAKWSARPWHIVDGKRPAKRKGALPQDLTVAERLHQAEECLFDCACGAAVHVAVFNYEMLSREPIASWVPLMPLDVIVYDEIHRLKSPTGKSSKVAGAWVDFSNRRIGLSGTPMPQHPWDIFGVYRALDPNIFGHVWTPFKAKYIEMQEAQIKTRSKAGDFYMKTTEFPSVIKPQYAEEFAEKVHGIMYRPTIDLKLPGVEHVTREVELEPAAWKAYRDLDRDMFADLTSFANGSYEGDLISIEETGAEREEVYLMPRNVIARIMRLMQLTGGTLPDDGEEDERGKTVRQNYRVSTAKADALAEELDNIGCVPNHPGGPEPVIVYCQFRSDLDAIRKVVEDAGLAYAEISGRRSDGLSSLGEMSEFADVVGVQIQSGGTGVDLTRARYGIWYSKGHSLGDYDQALKRQDRPGQTRPVVFIHLIVRDTVDEDVQQGLMERGSVVGAFLRSRGLDPAAFGIDETPRPEEFVDRAGRSGAQVVLPIDEFRPAPWNPAPGYVRKPVERDWSLLKEFDLEDL